MDGKDLKIDSAVGARNDGSNKYGQGATITCDGNKPYQEIGSNSLGKGDVQTSRPCAVIGPDRVVVPTSAADPYLKKPPDQWLHSEQSYRRPPDYPLKMTDYQSPSRNISPRQTYQENMQRIMVPPSYNSMKLNGDSDNNVALPKNKTNISNDPKYCDVPYNISPLTVDQKSYKNVDISVSIGNTNVNQSAPYMWPTNSVQQSRPYGAPEFYQYAEYSGCSGVRTLPPGRPQRLLPDDASPSYPERYFTDTNMRFKPYPTLKDGYPQQRYECMSNYSNPYHPPPYPPPRYDLQKPVAPHMYSSYPQVPVKYIDNRMAEPAIDGFQSRPNPPPSYSVAFHNQFIHPAYGPVSANCLQNKIFPYPPDLSAKQNHISKLAYENNKVYSDFDNVRNKPFGIPEHYYGNEMTRAHPVKGQVLLAKHLPSNTSLSGHPYYRNPQYRNYEHISGQMKNPDYSLNMANPVMRFAPHFSPNASSMSPSESASIHGSLQDENNYLGQKPIVSIRNADVRRLNTDMYGRYDYKYGPGLFRNSALHADNKQSNSSKDKKNIDVRQFLQQWNDDDENHETNNKQENKPSSIEKNQTNQNITNQEQLYVLGLVNVPSEELSKYEHIQKISKLPDNIKGYNSLELLNQFEEAIETSNLNSNISTTGKIRDLQGPFKQLPVQRATIPPLPRPVSPLDVEAKISQSVIHKEVGCNFEIKPCSPKMLNVEVAAPVQTVLDERVIEKLTNPLGVKSPKLKVSNDVVSFSIAKNEDNQINLLSTNLKNPSCKLTNNQFNSDDCLPSSKGNYSLNDFEGSSGVCLASLPRLDNEIEFNFPEVNQQFIDANKPDTVITATTLINSKSNVDYHQRSETDSQLKEVTLPANLTALVDSASYPKLSKYRKIKKIDNEPQVEVGFPVQAIRTDSVIIKNETAKELNLNSSLEKSQESTSSLEYNETRLLKSSPAITTRDGDEEKENLIESFFEHQQSSNDIVIDFSVNKNVYSFADSNYKSIGYNSPINDDQDFGADLKVTASTQQCVDVSGPKNIDVLISDVENDDTTLKPNNGVNNVDTLTTSMIPEDDNNLTKMVNDDKKAGISRLLISGKQEEEKEKYDDKSDNKNITDKNSHCVISEYPIHENFTEEYMIKSKIKNNIKEEVIKATSLINCLDPESNDKNARENMCLNKVEKNVKCFDEIIKHEKSLDSTCNIDSNIVAVDPNIKSWSITLDESVGSEPGYDLSCYKKENSLKMVDETRDEVSLKKSLAPSEVETDNYQNKCTKECDVPMKNIVSTDLINNNKIHEYVQIESENHNCKEDNSSIEKPIVEVTNSNVLKNVCKENRNNKDNNPTQLKENASDVSLVTNTYTCEVSSVLYSDTHHGQSKNFSDMDAAKIKQEIEENICPTEQIFPEVILFNKLHQDTEKTSYGDESFVPSNFSKTLIDEPCNNIESTDSDSRSACNIKEIPVKSPMAHKDRLSQINNDQISLPKDDIISGIDSDYLDIDSSRQNAIIDADIPNDNTRSENTINIIYSKSEVYHHGNTCKKPFSVKQFSPWIQKLMLYHVGKIVNNSTNPCIFDPVNDSKNSRDQGPCAFFLRNTVTNVNFSDSVDANDILVNTIPTVLCAEIPTLKEIAAQVLQNKCEHYKNTSVNGDLTAPSTEPLPESLSPLHKPILDELDSKKYSFKTTSSLKRSLSDSALNIFDDQSTSDHIWPKRRKVVVQDNIETNLFAENYCRLLQNHRRNSISTIFSEDVSFCILIDDNCIITEECIDTDRNYVEEEFKRKDICNRQNIHLSESQFVTNSVEKTIEDSWIEDVACVETVVSDNVDENEGSDHNGEEGAYIAKISSPNHNSISVYESGAEEKAQNEHSINHLRNIYEGCNNSDSFVNRIFRTPQNMEVNNLISNESGVYSQQQYTDADRQNLENILTGIDSNKSPNYEFVIKSNKTISIDVSKTSPITNSFLEISKASDQVFDTIGKELNEKSKMDYLQKTQYDIIHSCESSVDNVFSYQDRGDITRYSSSPEVSSTTSEEKCSSILLKITNYKGSIISELSNSNDARRISCKYTENNEYNKSNDKNTAINRPLITKAAQKYIPPLSESIPDLKVKLPLPPHSLLKFKELKKAKECPKIESKLSKRNNIESNLPKKIKPKFEDVLKSLDEIQIKMHKEKTKKVKKIIPKVVIKKNENGSHYTSSQNSETADPDLTGRKWQPWVFIERNMFVDKMASRNKTKAIFNHRKNEFVLKESFRRYKSVSSAKFVITQPRVDEMSKGQLKYTIKLKHSY